jgi:hypothetical protein
MALANSSDYAALVNKLFFYFDNVDSGIDWERLPIYGDILPEDIATIRAAYATYKPTRLARPSSTEVNPSSHGANQTTFGEG